MLRGATSRTNSCTKHWVRYNPTQPQWSRRARRARKAGPGSRPLPEGIEVCCRPRARDRRPCCWPAPASFPISRHPVRLCEQPAPCRAPEQVVGPEAAHRATLDPNITRPRGARVRFGRARVLARETRTPHRALSGKRSFPTFFESVINRNTEIPDDHGVNFASDLS